MKARILILDKDHTLEKTMHTLCNDEHLHQTIYTTNLKEAAAKAHIDRPDYIVYIPEDDPQHFEAFKTKLSQHYLTKDIPIICWSSSERSDAEGLERSAHTVVSDGTLKAQVSLADINDEVVAIEASLYDVSSILDLLQEEFYEKTRKTCSSV